MKGHDGWHHRRLDRGDHRAAYKASVFGIIVALVYVADLLEQNHLGEIDLGEAPSPDAPS